MVLQCINGVGSNLVEGRTKIQQLTNNLFEFLLFYIRHQLETPGKYAHLEVFYQDKKGTLSSNTTIPPQVTPPSSSSTPSRELLPEMKVFIILGQE